MENQYLDSNLDQEMPEYQYGSFLRRFAALFIDGLIFSVIAMAIFALTGGYTTLLTMIQDGELNQTAFFTMFFGVGIGLTIIQWLYNAYFESSEKQGTPGKQAMNLIVTDLNGERLTFGKATIRHFARLLPTLIPVIGSIYALADYLCQPFTEKKQTLHDMIAGTLVFKK